MREPSTSESRLRGGHGQYVKEADGNSITRLEMAKRLLRDQIRLLVPLYSIHDCRKDLTIRERRKLRNTSEGDKNGEKRGVRYAGGKAHPINDVGVRHRIFHEELFGPLDNLLHGRICREGFGYFLLQKALLVPRVEGRLPRDEIIKSSDLGQIRFEIVGCPLGGWEEVLDNEDVHENRSVPGHRFSPSSEQAQSCK